MIICGLTILHGLTSGYATFTEIGTGLFKSLVVRLARFKNLRRFLSGFARVYQIKVRLGRFRQVSNVSILSWVSVGFDKMCQPGLNPTKTRLKPAPKPGFHKFNDVCVEFETSRL